jgi:hypothetical protein
MTRLKSPLIDGYLHKKLECGKEIISIFSCWPKYWLDHIPSSTRLETHVIDYDELDWTPSPDDEIAVATATSINLGELLSYSFLNNHSAPIHPMYEGVLDFTATKLTDGDFSGLLTSTDALFASLHVLPPQTFSTNQPIQNSCIQWN